MSLNYPFCAFKKKQLDQLGWDPEHETDLHYRRTLELEQIQNLVKQEEELSRQISNLNFDYTDPCANFDRTQVKGMVAELISLDKENYDASTALEICAGGRLYNVSNNCNGHGKKHLTTNASPRISITALPGYRRKRKGWCPATESW